VQPTNCDPRLAPAGKHLLISHQVMQSDNIEEEKALALADLHQLFGETFAKHCRVLTMSACQQDCSGRGRGYQNCCRGSVSGGRCSKTVGIFNGRGCSPECQHPARPTGCWRAKQCHAARLASQCSTLVMESPWKCLRRA
jgi:hypothetical protein